MTCEIWSDKLDRYVDAELPDNEQRSFDEHLKNCPDCSLAAVNRFKLKQATQLLGRRFVPSAEFRAQIRSQISGKKQRSWRLSSLPVLASLAALLLVGAVSFFLYAQRAQRQQLLTEIADLHVSNLASASPVDVVSTDRHTVKPWFQGKLPFTFNLPELAGSEFNLIGGKVVYIDHEPAALLLFKHGNHYLSAFILQNRGPDSGTGMWGASGKEASFNTETWDSNGLRYIVITDGERQLADSLAKLLKDAARD